MAQKRKKNKKYIFWVVLVALFVAAAVMCYLVWNNYFRDKGEDQQIEEQSVMEKAKMEEIEPEQAEEMKEEGEKEKESIVAYEGESPNKKEELTGVVTYAGVNGDNLMIRMNIDQYLASGSCELNLVRGDVVYKDTANIVSGAATATCEGFNVPVGGLESGNYQIIIKMSSGGKTGTIIGEVEI